MIPKPREIYVEDGLEGLISIEIVDAPMCLRELSRPALPLAELHERIAEIHLHLRRVDWSLARKSA
jgi:hypothetical protein